MDVKTKVVVGDQQMYKPHGAFIKDNQMYAIISILTLKIQDLMIIGIKE